MGETHDAMIDREKIQIELIELDDGEARYDGSAFAFTPSLPLSLWLPSPALPCISFVPLIRFSVSVSESPFLIGNTIGSGILRNPPVKSPGVCRPPGLFLNVHKIRADSDNKR